MAGAVLESGALKLSQPHSASEGMPRCFQAEQIQRQYLELLRPPKGCAATVLCCYNSDIRDGVV